MKKIIPTLSCAILLSCTMNPNKEERIRSLENEIQILQQQIELLEIHMDSLSKRNAELHIQSIPVEDE